MTTDPFADILEFQIERELKKQHGFDRSKSQGEIERLAYRLLDRVMPEGYDNEVLEFPLVELGIIGALSKCIHTYNDIVRRFSDREMFYGPSKEIHDLRVERLRSEVSSFYTQEVIGKFCSAYGLTNRIVNRAKHKKFLPDGSWISNGVRFGP